MTDRSIAIEELRRELARLEIATSNIRQTIRNLENGEGPPPTQRRPPATKPSQASTSKTLDRNGNCITIGSTVRFLTKGRHSSTEGIVKRFSKNYTRVFAEDTDGFEVPRAPHNVRVIYDVI